ncbi:isochorismate synthase MenF [Edwardsiella ictaluri]|uniref:isochorismate synthase MenF n=1 Tax=Edwardsiella ictaluri TaxID=67780 RepID=UPI0039F73A52
MHHFTALIQRIVPQLQKAAQQGPGLVRVALPFAADDSDSMLAWLATQPLYPQFYWRHRSDEEEAAVCGALKVFRDAGQAQAFIRGYNHPDLRIWGLNAFDRVALDGYGEVESLLFLPRLALLRYGDRAELVVYLYSETSLQEDLPRAFSDLATLLPPQPLGSLQAQVLSAAHQPDHGAWCALLTQALAAIARNEFAKVVMARRTTLTLCEPLRAAQFLAASRAVNHRCYHFMLALAPHRAFLGSSPERLYRRIGRQLETEALAGTVARGENEVQRRANAAWLMQDGKNQHENLLVVDDICQRLCSGAGAPTLEVMAAEIVALRKVQHLRRSIHVILNRQDDAECLRRLQPTAAVAGLPREPARYFIMRDEPFARGWYAGSAGYLALAQAEFAVALRSALIEDERIHLYAGAGIVAGSDPQQEWLEIENKAAGLRTLLEGESL